MITLLRKIRKNLISESKFSSYLLYAIGEILLVVIGILIALQINTWNQERTARQSQKYFLNQLLVELDGDITALEEELAGLQNQIPLIEDLLLTLNKEKYTADEFNPQLKNYINAALYALSFSSNSATFDEMKSSGQLGVIDNKELRNQLVQLYNGLENLEAYVLEVNTFGRELAVDLGIRKGFAKYMDYQSSTYAKYRSEEELFAMRKSESIIEHLLNTNWTIFEMTPMFEEKLVEMKVVSKAIKKHLENGI